MNFWNKYIPFLVTLLIAGTVAAQSPDALKSRARQLQKSGVYLEAIASYEDYLAQRPSDNQARIELVNLLLKFNQMDRATPHIEKLKENDPENAAVQELVSQLDAHKQRKIQQKLNQYEEDIDDPKVDPKILLDFARYLASIGYSDRAIAMYDRYLQRAPNDNNARLEVAQQHAWKGSYEPSRTQLNDILAKDPSHVKARLLSADIYSWQGRDVEAYNEYKRVLRHDSDNSKAKKRAEEIASKPSFRENQLKLAVERDPEGPALLDLAKFYFERERLYEAEDLVSRRLEAKPEDEPALALHAQILQTREQQHLEKIATYEEILEKDPGNREATLAVARFYSSNKNYEKAIFHYTNYLNLHTDDREVVMERARVYSWAGNSERAAEDFRQIYSETPDNREARLGLADAMLKAGINLEEVERIYEEDVAQNPESIESRLGLADVYRYLGSYNRARIIYEEILEEDAENERALAGIKSLDQDVAPLIERVERKLRIEPDNVSLKLQLADLFLRGKRYHEALVIVDSLLIDEPEEEKLIALKEEIQSKQKSHYFDEIDRVEVIVENDPEDREAREYLIFLYSSVGMSKEAINHVKHLVEENPDEDELKLEYAQLLVASGQLENAVDVYRRLSEKYPNNFEYRFLYAKILSWNQQYDQSLREYDRAQTLNPESIEVRVQIANVHRWRGDMYKAYDEYNKIIAIEPKNEQAREALSALDGPFFRGVPVSIHSSEDSESFRYTEAMLSGIVSLTMRAQISVGVGNSSLEQADSTKRYSYGERGYFYLVNFAYQYNPDTRLSCDYRYYVYEEENTDWLKVSMSYKFSNLPDRHNLRGEVYYHSRDAIFELASTKGLWTWTDRLRSEKLGVWAQYHSPYGWVGEGSLNFISVDDGNSRTDAWLDAGYPLWEFLTVGGHYDLYRAKYFVPQYWSPDRYETIAIWARLHRDFQRWNYAVRGDLGKVIGSDANTRRITAELGYRHNQNMNFGLSYIYLRTTRNDGLYWYRGISGFFTYSF
ncbi:tetratricopeptide repeat protein [bacterium]|nr:tetratricopeptide repeat protein [bacterium]